MIETTLVESWLHTRLSTDAILTSQVSDRIYAYLAPARAATPFVVFNAQSPGFDVMGVGTARVMLNCLYQVKVVVQDASFAPAKDAADRIDTLLHGATGTPPGGQVLGCVREGPLAYAEVSDGIEYRHLGGLYRIWVQET